MEQPANARRRETAPPCELRTASRVSRRSFIRRLGALSGGVVALSAGAAAYVGNDSGPTHLAAALGTPTVAIFGPTDPVQFAPRGRSVRVIHAARLEDISAPDVLAALDGLAPLPGAGKRSGGAKAGRADHPGR